MKITANGLSIPPYISTTWQNIDSLYAREDGVLVILLQSGSEVQVPHLTKESIQEIFEAHARSMEEPAQDDSFLPPLSFSLPIKEGTGSLLTTAMQHDPDKKDLEPLPLEILQKIVGIARAFGLDESALQAAEEGCHCMFCQLSRAIKGTAEEIEEEVTEEDLRFRIWDIAQEEEQLYSVTNPLDANEQYKVFLGAPIGCTCGSKNCEHIRAVLNT